MVRLLNTLWAIFSNAHEIEAEGGFRKLRNSLTAIVVAPLIFIVPGAFLGGISWTLKVVVLQIGVWLAVLFLLWLAKRRLLIGTEIGAIVESTGKKKLGLIGALEKGLVDYIKVVAAILASEVTIGLISLWLPAHQNPKMFFLLFIVAAAIIFYKIWNGGELWWPKVVYKMAVFTLIMSVITILFPAASEQVTARIHPDDEIASFIKKAIPTPEEKATEQKAITVAQQNATEKFYLPPRGEVDAEYDEVPTVDAGPGTIHRLRGDAPFRIISGKPDGTSKIYNMPAGWSTWTGAAPAGKLYLVSGKDAKTKTLVEIMRVQ